MQRLLHELQVHQIELEMQNAELRQARDEVEKSLARYTDLYDFAPVGYFTLDRDGVIRAVNLSGASLLGIERSRLLGCRFEQVVVAVDRPAFTEFLQSACKSQAKAACELALIQKEKGSIFAQIEAVTDASGQECRIAIIDISLRRQMEEELKILHADLAARAAQLEDANVELETFNYSVSHDLRIPVTAIHGYCQVLRELCGNRLDENCTEYLWKIQEGALHMSRLIGTLFDFSRLTHVEMRREPVDLSTMAKAVAKELKQAVPDNRGIFRIADGVVAVGDPDLLRVVLDNLLGNAWKFARDRRETVIEFGETVVDGQTICFVRDNGPGFDMAHADKLFLPFQRLPETNVEGHGIGLATVERIVIRHGWRVWAESKLGEGATFFFTFDKANQVLTRQSG